MSPLPPSRRHPSDLGEPEVARFLSSLAEAIVAHHTTPDQAADVFRRVAPRVAVFTHGPPGPAVVERTRRTYNGRVEQGEDLMVIDIGDDVVVRRPPTAAPPR